MNRMLVSPSKLSVWVQIRRGESGSTNTSNERGGKSTECRIFLVLGILSLLWAIQKPGIVGRYGMGRRAGPSSEEIEALPQSVRDFPELTSAQQEHDSQ